MQSNWIDMMHHFNFRFAKQANNNNMAQTQAQQQQQHHGINCRLFHHPSSKIIAIKPSPRNGRIICVVVDNGLWYKKIHLNLLLYTYRTHTHCVFAIYIF